MEEDIALQRTHEEQGRGARIPDVQDAGGGGAAEVIGDDGEAAAWGAVALGIERQDERGVLRHHDVRADHPLGEGDELLGDAAEDRARIRRGRGGGELEDAGGGVDDFCAAHGLAEEGVFGIDVPEEGGRRDVQLAGDVGESGGGEALRGEDASGGGEDLLAPNARRPAHL